LIVVAKVKGQNFKELTPVTTIMELAKTNSLQAEESKGDAIQLTGA
jgi:hypothetical protein